MARKERTVVIETQNRDQGKHFLLTEMSARQGEAWGMRALLALAASGVEIPDDIMGAGLAGIAFLGVRALGGVNYVAVEPLLEEMLAQVHFVPNPAVPQVHRALIDDDTEEIATRLYLRRCILELHVDFFTDAGLLAKVRGNMAAPGVSSPTPTSQAQ